MIRILCVLKTGGDFTCEYVKKLYVACSRNIKEPFNFVCLTDDLGCVCLEMFTVVKQEMNNEHFVVPSYRVLEKGFSGWWSKIELFNFTGANLYFDLDTVIFSDLGEYIKAIKELKPNEFIGVKAFNPIRSSKEETRFNSGVMGWNGDFRFVLEEFDYEKHSTEAKYCGDQDYIHERLRNHGISVKFWQDVIGGLYSYRRHCRNNMVPKDAKIVCFHGYPRPLDVINIGDEAWVKEKWGNLC